MNYDLKSIEYQHDYVYKVVFEDGTGGLVDFADVLVILVVESILRFS